MVFVCLVKTAHVKHVALDGQLYNSEDPKATGVTSRVLGIGNLNIWYVLEVLGPWLYQQLDWRWLHFTDDVFEKERHAHSCLMPYPWFWSFHSTNTCLVLPRPTVHLLSRCQVCVCLWTSQSLQIEITKWRDVCLVQGQSNCHIQHRQE